MGRLAIVGGHSILAPDLAGVVFPDGARRQPAHGARGAVTALDAGDYLVLPRHGLDDYVPAHLVDHARNLLALQAAGCDRVLALSSVGALRTEHGVGTFLAPDDFIALDRVPIGVYDDTRCHVVPGFTESWRARVLEAWARVTDEPLVDGGVYWQSNGPRFETPAEVRFLAPHADVVGMTAASECIVANEIGLDYAAVCVVDNVANGLGTQVLTREEFEAGKAANQRRVVAALSAIAPELLPLSLAVVDATFEGDRVTLRAVDGTITALGADVRAEPGDEVLDATGRLLLPGLVNGHTHAAMTLFRGYGSDLSLMDWLEHRIWPAEARLDPDDVYWGTRLACAEMIRTGTVRFWDMYWHPDAVGRAVEDAGIRAVVGFPLVDGVDPKRAKEVQADGESVLDLLGAFGPRVTPSLTPHGIYTVSAGTLEWAAGEAAARDLPIHLHFLEIEDEIKGCHERYGEGPAVLLDRVGALGERSVLAHAVWTEPSDRALIAERGATVVTNPVSNLKLAVGRVFPYAATRAAGIPVGLGTDGAASNNSLDLLADCKVLALIQKHEQDDPAFLPADEAWSVATGGLAPLLGGTPVAVGQPADFVLARADAVALQPGNTIANLVYAASGDVIDATVVDGVVLMRDATIEGEDEIVARVREQAERLGVVSDEQAD